MDYPAGQPASGNIVYSLLGFATISAFVASTIVGRLTVLLAGLGIVAYVLGIRHGIDADHIAAIDNRRRKLMQDKNQRPFTVGMWFSRERRVRRRSRRTRQGGWFK